MALRSVGRVTAQNSAFFLCDMQERFRSSISHFPAILNVSQRLVSAAKEMTIPLFVTEQYPDRLGKTCEELDTSGAVGVWPKTKFSMVVPPLAEKLKEMPERRSIVLFGIEGHVCVQQTAIDLLEQGLDVHIVVDATSSRSMVDRKYGLERMRQSGAYLTTCESMLFQLMGDAKHPKFKAVQSLIKDLPPDSGLLTF